MSITISRRNFLQFGSAALLGALIPRGKASGQHISHFPIDQSGYISSSTEQRENGILAVLLRASSPVNSGPLTVVVTLTKNLQTCKNKSGDPQNRKCKKLEESIRGLTEDLNEILIRYRSKPNRSPEEISLFSDKIAYLNAGIAIREAIRRYYPGLANHYVVSSPF
ncbi:MAG: hypothetical protein SFU25_01085 [Candidatus Caenarcaniphilales bacterium]|nr:hypothetical protein [Candidatus Caenarcaniphilales bacterium]